MSTATFRLILSLIAIPVYFTQHSKIFHNSYLNSHFVNKILRENCCIDLNSDSTIVTRHEKIRLCAHKVRPLF